MPRAPRDSRIETRTARINLAIRNKPYWRQIERGLFIGYRCSSSTSAWVMRHAMGGRYVEDRVGTPDDRLEADGTVVLSYKQTLKAGEAIYAKPPW